MINNQLFFDSTSNKLNLYYLAIYNSHQNESSKYSSDQIVYSRNQLLTIKAKQNQINTLDLQLVNTAFLFITTKGKNFTTNILKDSVFNIYNKDKEKIYTYPPSDVTFRSKSLLIAKLTIDNTILQYEAKYLNLYFNSPLDISSYLLFQYKSNNI